MSQFQAANKLRSGRDGCRSQGLMELSLRSQTTSEVGHAAAVKGVVDCGVSGGGLSTGQRCQCIYIGTILMTGRSSPQAQYH